MKVQHYYSHISLDFFISELQKELQEYDEANPDKTYISGQF